MDFGWHALSFVVAIGVLVTVHEFGHFWVAQRLGVKVLKFSIGFGRALFTWRTNPHGTEYVLAAVPLGGYVKMLDEREEGVQPADLPRAFNRQPLRVRCAVVLAGPLFNFLFAVAAYWATFVIGVSGPRALIEDVAPGSVAAQAGMGAGEEIERVGGRHTPTWEGVVQAVIGGTLNGGPIAVEVRGDAGDTRTLSLDMSEVSVDDLARGQFFTVLGIEPRRPRMLPIIGSVEPGSPSERAGLLSGDLILAADGQPIPGWREWVDYVRAHPGVAMNVRLERGGSSLTLVLEPAAFPDDSGRTIGKIGATRQPQPELLEKNYAKYYTLTRYGPLEAGAKALVKTYDTSMLTLGMFWKMLRLEISLENLSGPISIARYAGYSAKIGPSKFLEFLAIVSISLGILNLLPIPVLDGGHLMYYFIEFLKGRPVSEQAQFIGQRFGIAMLFGLMGLAFYNDIARLFG